MRFTKRQNAQEGTLMAPRLTVADLALIVAEDRKTLPALIAEQVAKAVAQFATPAPVAQVITLPTQEAKAAKKASKAAAKTAQVTVAAPAPTVEVVTPATPAPATASSLAGDKLRAFVEGKSLAFAKGGRTNLDRAALAAIARVLKTGTAEVVTITQPALNKRGITGLAIGLNGEGGVLTQYVFNPSATRS